MSPQRQIHLQVFKKLFILTAFVSVCYAGENMEVIGPFGTLDNTHAAVTLPNSISQDLLNVDITPQGKSVKKRKGYGSAYTLSNTTSAIHGTYLFYDSNGADVALSFNDRNMNVSVSGASPIVFFSTGPNGATYQCVDAAAFAYCANTSRTSLVKVNSSTYSLITNVVSTGTILAVTPERLVMSGFSEAPSRIDFSKSNDFSTWAVGGQPTDPINFTIVSPGSRITHLTYAHGRVYWFKDSSFGYILPGQTQSDWVVRTVNSFIGTLYNTSVFRDDILYFQGNDGHFYAWDGSNLTKLSTNIQATIDVTQGRSPGIWIQSSAADWNSGSFDDTRYVDTTTVAGIIQPTFPDLFNSYRDGNSGTLHVWDNSFNSVTATTTAILNSQLTVGATTQGSSLTSYLIRTATPSCSISVGNTYYVDIVSFSSQTTGNIKFVMALSSNVETASTIFETVPTSNGSWVLEFTSSSPTTIQIPSARRNSVAEGSKTETLNIVQLNSHSLSMSFYIDSSNYQYTVNGSSIIKRGTHTFPNISPYVYFGMFYNTSASTATNFTIDNFSVIPETFTFSSAIKNAPSLTTNDSFIANYTTDGGSHTFFHRARSGTFTIASATPTYFAVSNGAVPTSTGTNFEIRDYFAVTSTASSLSLQDFTQNWFEGAATDKTYALYHDNALWWAVASGTGASTNNKIIKYDLLNQGYVLYDIPMNGLYERQQSLYFGSPSVGSIYKFGSADNDNGAAINSYWKSKDLFGTNPFLDKDYKSLSVFTGSVANSSMTVTWTTNGSSSTVMTVPLYDGQHSFLRYNRNLPLRVGNTINIKFGNNAIDQPFEVYGIQVGTNEKPWSAQ